MRASFAIYTFLWAYFTNATLGFSSKDASRRAFLTKASTSAVVALVGASQKAKAAPEILNTPSGIKYAVTKPPKDKGASPLKGDIVAIEYTGYLTDGSVFDGTHSVGKKNALMFELGGNAVIPGVSEMVQQMSVGESVQAIIPPSLAFGDKGICLENGECLVKPKSTLVYDIFLKRSAIPPP
jgi:FKBP-type peptidyl-prolyl cis-trans isomerase